jgi:hypothetical protein
LYIGASIGKSGIRRLIDVGGQNFELKSGSLEQVPAGR